MVQAASLYTYRKVRYWLLKTPKRPVHQLYNTETCRVQCLLCMKCNGPSRKFVHLQQGKVLIVENSISACISTVQQWNLSCKIPIAHAVLCSKQQVCTPTTRLGHDYQKPSKGLYINCTTLKLVVYNTYTSWSVMVQVDGLYTYNKVRYWLLKTP